MPGTQYMQPQNELWISKAALEGLYARVMFAETESRQLREAIQELFRVYWNGTDVDHAKVSVACLTLFARANDVSRAPVVSRPHAPPPIPTDHQPSEEK